MVRWKLSILAFSLTFFLIPPTAKEQDSGKYMVKAVNSGGEAQSIADFLVLESQPERMVEITKTVVFSDLPPDQLKVSFNLLITRKSFFTFSFYPKILS